MSFVETYRYSRMIDFIRKSAGRYIKDRSPRQTTGSHYPLPTIRFHSRPLFPRSSPRFTPLVLHGADQRPHCERRRIGRSITPGAYTIWMQRWLLRWPTASFQTSLSRKFIPSYPVFTARSKYMLSSIYFNCTLSSFEFKYYHM